MPCQALSCPALPRPAPRAMARTEGSGRDERRGEERGPTYRLWRRIWPPHRQGTFREGLETRWRIWYPAMGLCWPLRLVGDAGPGVAGLWMRCAWCRPNGWDGRLDERSVRGQTGMARSAEWQGPTHDDPLDSARRIRGRSGGRAEDTPTAAGSARPDNAACSLVLLEGRPLAAPAAPAAKLRRLAATAATAATLGFQERGCSCCSLARETRMRGEARTDVFACGALRLRLPSPVCLNTGTAWSEEQKRQSRHETTTAGGSAGATITCGKHAQHGLRGLFGGSRRSLGERERLVRTSTPTTPAVDGTLHKQGPGPRAAVLSVARCRSVAERCRSGDEAWDKALNRGKGRERQMSWAPGGLPLQGFAGSGGSEATPPSLRGPCALHSHFSCASRTLFSPSTPLEPLQTTANTFRAPLLAAGQIRKQEKKVSGACGLRPVASARERIRNHRTAQSPWAAAT
jgi:hypothetical protein